MKRKERGEKIRMKEGEKSGFRKGGRKQDRKEEREGGRNATFTSRMVFTEIFLQKYQLKGYVSYSRKFFCFRTLW